MPIRGPVHAKLHKKDAAETLHVGPLTIRIYEDGSLTENRVSGVLLEIPAGKSGPPMHWHRFHDELFLVIKGESDMALGGMQQLIVDGCGVWGRVYDVRHARR